MKFTIKNFKAIKDLNGLEIKPFNIISGVNSSGKSSLIQFILLIKQTIDARGANKPLVLNGDWVNLGRFDDVVTKGSEPQQITFELLFSDKEFQQTQAEYLKITECRVLLEFVTVDEEIQVQRFEVNYREPGALKEHHWIRFIRDHELYRSETNSGIFNNDFFQVPVDLTEDSLHGTILFTYFLPQLFSAQIPTQDAEKGNKATARPARRNYDIRSIEPKFKDLQSTIENLFDNLSYIGPLRETPNDLYSAPKFGNTVGPKGQYAAYYLAEEAANQITYNEPSFNSEGLVSYKLVTKTLEQAINFWLCETFRLATKIYGQQYRDEYRINVVNHFGVESTIKHVGFGISQVLPIVLEGLRLPVGGTLILEQPEIHLHPKVQSLLFDYLFSVILSGKRVIVETHSDHLILRMRRRIAEDLSNKITESLNLIFIEERSSDNVFRKLDFSELGSLTYYPPHFIEQQDGEYRAIVRAQALKKISNQSAENK